MTEYIKKFRETSASLWYDEPVKVCWGIPINPTYKDSPIEDRYGKKLSIKESNSYYYYMQLNRQEWRKTSNVLNTGEDDD